MLTAHPDTTESSSAILGFLPGHLSTTIILLLGGLRPSFGLLCRCGGKAFTSSGLPRRASPHLVPPLLIHDYIAEYKADRLVQVPIVNIYILVSYLDKTVNTRNRNVAPKANGTPRLPPNRRLHPRHAKTETNKGTTPTNSPSNIRHS